MIVIPSFSFNLATACTIVYATDFNDEEIFNYGSTSINTDNIEKVEILYKDASVLPEDTDSTDLLTSNWSLYQSYPDGSTNTFFMVLVEEIISQEIYRDYNGTADTERLFCSHYWITTTEAYHTVYVSGACSIAYYSVVICEKCQQEQSRSFIKSINYAVCPHK